MTLVDGIGSDMIEKWVELGWNWTWSTQGVT